MDAPGASPPALDIAGGAHQLREAAVMKAAFGATMLGAPNAAYEPAFPGLAAILPVCQVKRHPNLAISAYRLRLDFC